MMTNKTYDWLKWTAIIALPAISTFIAFVGPLWGLEAADKVAQTVTAIGTLLGALLGISSVRYYRDEVN